MKHGIFKLSVGLLFIFGCSSEQLNNELLNTELRIETRAIKNKTDAPNPALDITSYKTGLFEKEKSDIVSTCLRLVLKINY